MSKSDYIIGKRQELDKVLNSVRALKSGREVSIVITKLQEAFMTLGLVLKFLGETEHPYQQGDNKETKAIDPKTDVSEDKIDGLVDGDQIYNLKLLREVLGSLEAGLTPAMIGGTLNSSGELWLNESKKSVTLARLWLGMELGNHRSKVAVQDDSSAAKEIEHELGSDKEVKDASTTLSVTESDKDTEEKADTDTSKTTTSKSTAKAKAASKDASKGK